MSSVLLFVYLFEHILGIKFSSEDIINLITAIFSGGCILSDSLHSGLNEPSEHFKDNHIISDISLMDPSDSKGKGKEEEQNPFKDPSDDSSTSDFKDKGKGREQDPFTDPSNEIFPNSSGFEFSESDLDERSDILRPREKRIKPDEDTDYAKHIEAEEAASTSERGKLKVSGSASDTYVYGSYFSTEVIEKYNNNMTSIPEDSDEEKENLFPDYDRDLNEPRPPLTIAPSRSLNQDSVNQTISEQGTSSNIVNTSESEQGTSSNIVNTTDHVSADAPVSADVELSDQTVVNTQPTGITPPNPQNTPSLNSEQEVTETKCCSCDNCSIQ